MGAYCWFWMLSALFKSHKFNQGSGQSKWHSVCAALRVCLITEPSQVQFIKFSKLLRQWKSLWIRAFSNCLKCKWSCLRFCCVSALPAAYSADRSTSQRTQSARFYSELLIKQDRRHVLCHHDDHRDRWARGGGAALISWHNMDEWGGWGRSKSY